MRTRTGDAPSDSRAAPDHGGWRGDKGYDTAEFVASCRALNVTPHVAQNERRPGGSALDLRTTDWPGYAVSQRVRKRIEEIFGWIKTVVLVCHNLPMKLSDRIVVSGRPEQDEFSSLTDDFKKWSEWLHSIESAVTELCVGREVYKETLNMYRRNPAIQKPSLFYSWMRGLFVTWSVTLIGRLVDDKRGTRSFVRFLRSIQKSSHPPSREHHVALYITAMTNFSDEEAARIANREFDRLVGSTEDFLPKKQVEADIATLLQVTKPIIRFRHERVAHVDENPSEQLPTYEHLDAGILVLVELLRKYSLLINGVSADPFPTIQYDWLAIFRVPWIVESK